MQRAKNMPIQIYTESRRKSPGPKVSRYLSITLLIECGYLTSNGDYGTLRKYKLIVTSLWCGQCFLDYIKIHNSREKLSDDYSISEHHCRPGPPFHDMNVPFKMMPCPNRITGMASDLN
ncbi:hypothetical protein CEXT_240721 [Caerostris extrusa]|uniref:Uncharacterized protein n=1 Tax=Caerostris extrusa TaxID=172846 RepID=A0AAV4TL81_CAEEX|nr:hypothetical protein CEXT_240721 [Caerostris extrusa]